MKLSIVTTLYNSANWVGEFYERASAAAAAICDDFEIIMVDDGSPDDSLSRALAISARDSRVCVVELSRNFGHHKALMTGMECASGDLCFLIDSDLEEAPELLGQFWNDMQRNDVDVVYGFQEARRGGAVERATGAVAYKLFDWLIPHKIPRNHITVRLMRRDYVDSLLRHRESKTAIGGLWVITGYRQLGVAVQKITRSPTTYSAGRRWLLLMESITSFSEVPLIGIFYLGTGISGLAGLVGVVLIVRRLTSSALIEGWVSVMLSVWFLGGLQIFCLGVIGLYVSRIFIETKNRPYTIIRRIHRGENQVKAATDVS